MFKSGKITLIGASIFFLFSLVLAFNFSTFYEQQFSLHAESLLEGKLYLVTFPVNMIDLVLKEGHYYFPLSPFPSFLLLPFTFLFRILFHQSFLQSALHFPLVLGTFYLIYELARKAKFGINDSLYLAFGFCFASVYHLVAFIPWSWYFSHVVAVFLSFLALYEYRSKRRFWLMGLLSSFIFLTRPTASVLFLFFVLELWTHAESSFKKKVLNTSFILVPIFFSGLFSLFFNYTRFGNVFDNGYMHSSAFMLSDDLRFEVLNYGLFQLRNIPTNFYYYFIKSLDPVLVNFKSFSGNTYILRFPYITINYPGVSFFVVSPLFLHLFKSSLSEKWVKNALACVLVTLFILLTYYWPGWRQTGPRYLLDLLPLTTLLLFNSFKTKKLSFSIKTLILCSAFFNIYLLIAVI